MLGSFGSSLDNIRIVLVRTYHPGNIGSAARAMKTMGMNNLSLVNPVNFPSDEALKMARSAGDVVENAQRVDSVYEAVEDCEIVMASTARPRGFDLPELSPEQAAEQLLAYVGKGDNRDKDRGRKVALLFGPERMGLSNDDLQYANYRVTIPTSPDYPSLNMAAAVQILSYEVFKQYSKGVTATTDNTPGMRPSIEASERLYVHLEETLTETGFIFKKHPGEVMKKLRGVMTRAELTANEVSIFRGVLRSIQRHIGKES